MYKDENSFMTKALLQALDSSEKSNYAMICINTLLNVSELYVYIM